MVIYKEPMKSLYGKNFIMNWFVEVCARLGIRTHDFGLSWGVSFQDKNEADLAWELFREEYRRVLALK